jgi:hypothetical protein
MLCNNVIFLKVGLKLVIILAIPLEMIVREVLKIVFNSTLKNFPK